MLGVKRDDARYYKDDCDEKLEFKEDKMILSSSLLNQLIELEGIKEECKAFLVYNVYDREKIDCKWTLAPKAKDEDKDEKEKEEKEDEKDVKRGTYGAVRQACCDNDCGYAVKIDKNGYNCNEVNHHIKLSESGIAPRIYEVWRCVNSSGKTEFTILIMDRLWMTLLDFLISPNTKVDQAKDAIRQIPSLIASMFAKGIVHNDVHLDNFMLDVKGRLYIIDLGKSQKVRGHNQNSDLILLTQHLYEMPVLQLLQNSDNRNRTADLYKLVAQFKEDLEREKGRTIVLGGIGKKEDNKKEKEDKKERIFAEKRPDWADRGRNVVCNQKNLEKIIAFIEKDSILELGKNDDTIIQAIQNFKKVTLTDECKTAIYQQLLEKFGVF